MKIKVSASEVARTFSEILNRVRYRGETFVVERGGQPVCEISPAAPIHFTVSDLLRLLETLPEPDKEYLDVVEKLIIDQPRLQKSPWQR